MSSDPDRRAKRLQLLEHGNIGWLLYILDQLLDQVERIVVGKNVVAGVLWTLAYFSIALALIVGAPVLLLTKTIVGPLFSGLILSVLIWRLGHRNMREIIGLGTVLIVSIYPSSIYISQLEISWLHFEDPNTILVGGLIALLIGVLLLCIPRKRGTP